MKQVLIVMDKKVRNLEKRKGKLDGYKEKKDSGTTLEKDQQLAIEKYGEVIQNLEFARELQKHFTALAQEADRYVKKQAKKEKADRQGMEVKRIGDILRYQNLQSNLSHLFFSTKNPQIFKDTLILDMGRKSAKGKEKKKKRKEENAKLEVSLAKVEAANKIADPLELLSPFKKFERNGLNLRIECMKVANMEKDLVDWAFQLTKANMQKLYEESDWGWKDKDKYAEMTEDRAQYLVAFDVTTGKPVAFTHFRFDMELDDEVVYCYEIQLKQNVGGKV